MIAVTIERSLNQDTRGEMLKEMGNLKTEMEKIFTRALAQVQRNQTIQVQGLTEVMPALKAPDSIV